MDVLCDKVTSCLNLFLATLMARSTGIFVNKEIRCLEAWHINMNQHALNRDDGSYLPQEYLHLVGK